LSTEQVTELADGVTVVSEQLEQVRSVALGFFVDAGSAFEAETEGGYSHLLEHLLFRGTASYESEQIDQLFDSMGAELNAGTSKESTSVFTRVLDDHVDEAFPALAEMVWQPRIDDRSVEQEREIVLEELSMYEDDPQEQVFDIAAAALFAGAPLGRPVIGTRESVGGADPQEMREFHRHHYRGGTVVVAGAGAIEHERLVEHVRRAIDVAGGEAGPLPERRPHLPASPECAGQLSILEKPTEQTHLVVTSQGLPVSDERRFALRVLDSILGGSSSSRLFQEVREKRALAYSVFSFASFHEQTGQVGIYVGTRHENVATTCDVIAAELDRLREDGVTEAELDRARENVKGRTVLAMESTAARMNRLGSAVLAGLPLLSIDEVVDRLDAVTAEDLLELGRTTFAAPLRSVAAIGPDSAAIGSVAARICSAL